VNRPHSIIIIIMIVCMHVYTDNVCVSVAFVLHVYKCVVTSGCSQRAAPETDTMGEQLMKQAQFGKPFDSTEYKLQATVC